jgi:hypothetical protein
MSLCMKRTQMHISLTKYIHTSEEKIYFLEDKHMRFHSKESSYFRFFSEA